MAARKAQFYPNLSSVSLSLGLQRRYIEIRKSEASTQQFWLHRSLAINVEPNILSLSQSPSCSWPRISTLIIYPAPFQPRGNFLGEGWKGRRNKGGGNGSGGGGGSSFLSSQLSRLVRAPRHISIRVLPFHHNRILLHRHCVLRVHRFPRLFVCSLER